MQDKAIERINRLQRELNGGDTDRSIRYARDLLGGLKKMESYNQGVTFFGSARMSSTNKYYKIARKLAKNLAYRGHTIITGGSTGIMEAANRGAFEIGGQSIGLNVKLPNEQSANHYLTDSFEFNYFFARKVILTASAKAWVFFPGGFGTLDELSEILTLIQTAKIPPTPVILFSREFWEPLDVFLGDVMQKKFKTIGPNDRRLYTITDDPSVAMDMIDSVSTQRVGDMLSSMSPVD